MKRVSKRILAIFIAVVITMGIVPFAGFVGVELPMFSEFLGTEAEAAALSENDVFMMYPRYLSNDASTEMEFECQNAYQNAFNSCKEESGVGTLATLLCDGVEIGLKEIASVFNWSDSYAEQNLKDATITFLKASSDTALSNTVNKVEDVYKPIKKVYGTASSISSELNKSEFISNVITEFKSLTGMTDSEAKSILGLIYDNSKKASTLNSLKKVMDVTDEALAIFKFAVQISELYAIDIEYIDTLMKNIDDSSDLYRGLELVREDRTKDFKSYIISAYFSDKVVEFIGGKITAFFLGPVAGPLCSVVTFVLSEYIYDGKMADDFIQYAFLAGFASSIGREISDLRMKFFQDNGADDEIEKYKALYPTYLIAMRAASEAAYNFSSGKYKDDCQTWAKIMGTSYTYETHIDYCIAAISDAIEAGEVDTTGQFATVPENTYEASIAARLKKVKEIYPPNSGKTFYERVGSIYGGSQAFASKVFNMLYDIKMSQPIQLNRQYKLDSEDNVKNLGMLSGNEVTVYSVKNLLSNAKVGDVIVSHGSKGVHMMIVSSVGSSGVTVYDCDSPYNTDTTEDIVQEYEFSFSAMAENFSTSRSVYYSSNYTATYEGGITLYRSINRETIDTNSGLTLDYNSYDDSSNYVIEDGVLKAYNGNRIILDIPEGVKKIGDSCFNGNQYIIQVNLPDSLEKIGYQAFYECKKLRTINFNKKLKEIGMFAFARCYSLRAVMMGNSVELIDAFAFQNCTSLSALSLSENIREIGTASFDYCKKLDTITIPQSVVRIESYAFYQTGYYNNKENWENKVLYIDDCLIEANPEIEGNYTTKNGTRLIADYAFRVCEKLNKVTISDSVVFLGSEAFNSCGIKEVVLGKSIQYNDDHINGIYIFSNISFVGCNNLEKIIVSEGTETINLTKISSKNSIIYIPSSVKTINGGSSEMCKGIIVDDENKYFSSDEHGVLFNKNKTVLLQYPNSSENTHYSIPEGVEKVNYSGFFFCTNLKSIDVPLSLKRVLNDAFGDGNKEGYEDSDYKPTILEDVYYAGSESQWNEIDIESNNEGLTNAKIHYSENDDFNFFEMIASFFKSIIDFFRNLFVLN